MKIRAFFHIADLDGHCSGAIFRYVAKIMGWSGVKLIPYNYGYDIDLEDLKDADVYFLDCTPSPIETMAAKIAAVAANIYVCDHHKTALEDPAFKQFLSNGNSRVGEDSGCALTWEFFKEVLGEMPTVVRLLSDYDVWKDGDKQKWNELILPVQFAMKGRTTDPTTDESAGLWRLVLEDAFDVDKLVRDGKIIMQYEKKRLDMVAKSGAFEAEFAGKRAICMNTCTKSSQAFESVFDPAKHDCMFAFTVRGPKEGGMKFNVSLYAVNPRVNCGEIMQRYGGGGHVGAAGCEARSMTIENGVLKLDGGVQR